MLLGLHVRDLRQELLERRELLRAAEEIPASRRARPSGSLRLVASAPPQGLRCLREQPTLITGLLAEPADAVAAQPLRAVDLIIALAQQTERDAAERWRAWRNRPRG